jgi:microcompartment protein CcmL/EutN
MAEPALGIVEVSSIARGVVVADAMAKKAPIRILQSRPISPGKHIVVVAGEVAEVDEAMLAGVAAAGATLVDRLFLPAAHESLAPLLRGASNPQPIDSAAIFETHTICAAVLAADAAAKAAEVTLVDLRLGQGIGGKGVFMLSGRLDAIEAAVLAGREVVEAALVVNVEVIAAPHEDLRARLVW